MDFQSETGRIFLEDESGRLLAEVTFPSVSARVADIRLSGRNTQGVRIMRIAEGSEVVAVARTEAEEEEEAEEAALDTTEEFVEEPTEDPSLDMNIADGEAEEPKDEI